MQCLIRDIYDDKISKKDFIINSIKNIQKDDKLEDTYRLWGKDIIINYVAIDEHDISISDNVIWVY